MGFITSEEGENMKSTVRKNQNRHVIWKLTPRKDEPFKQSGHKYIVTYDDTWQTLTKAIEVTFPEGFDFSAAEIYAECYLCIDQ
jgi:hypothetical protein